MFGIDSTKYTWKFHLKVKFTWNLIGRIRLKKCRASKIWLVLEIEFNWVRFKG